jgi:hypothetical protein
VRRTRSLQSQRQQLPDTLALQRRQSSGLAHSTRRCGRLHEEATLRSLHRVAFASATPRFGHLGRPVISRAEKHQYPRPLDGPWSTPWLLVCRNSVRIRLSQRLFAHGRRRSVVMSGSDATIRDLRPQRRCHGSAIAERSSLSAMRGSVCGGWIFSDFNQRAVHHAACCR